VSYHKNKACFHEPGCTKAMNLANSHPKLHSTHFIYRIAPVIYRIALSSAFYIMNRNPRIEQNGRKRHLPENIFLSNVLPVSLGIIGLL